MRAFGLADLDNLEGAAAPIELEPVAGRSVGDSYTDALMQRTAEIMRTNPHMTVDEAGYRASRDMNAERTRAARSARRAEAMAGTAQASTTDESWGNSYVPDPAGMTLPGPRDPFTGRAAPPSVLATSEDVEGYEFRRPAADASPEELARHGDSNASPYRGGNVLPSQRDMDLWERGMVQILNPETGEMGTRVAHSAADVAGAPGRRGARYGLTNPAINPATGEPLRDATGAPAAKYRVTSSLTGSDGTQYPAVTPTGTGVDFYEPTPEYRAMLQAREDDRRLERLAARAGVSYDDAETMLAEGRDLDDLRRMGRSKLAGEKAGRQAEVVRRAQERYNPTALLGPEWREYVLAQRLLRDPRMAGASPTDVAQAREQAKAAMESRLGVGRGFQTTPAQEQAAAQLAVDAQGEIVTEAERYVEDNFAWDNQGVSGFFASDYSAEEQDETVRWLMNTYGPPAGDMTPDRAREIVAGIAAKKRKTPDGSGAPAPVSGPGGAPRPGGTPYSRM